MTIAIIIWNIIKIICIEKLFLLIILIRNTSKPREIQGVEGTDLKKQENNETIISPRILLLSWRTILIRPIGREKQSLAPSLLVEIKLFDQENNNILGEIIVIFCFDFVNPFPEKETQRGYS